MPLPPWLQISPTTGVPLFLHGFSEGQHAAAANLQRDQQNQLAAQHAAEVAQETEVQKQRVAATLASDLIDRQVKAQTAARQLAGMQKYQSLVGSGADPTQALLQSAPDMFFQHPEAMTTAMHQNEAAKALAAQRTEQNKFSQGHLDVAKAREERESGKGALTPSPIELKTPTGTHLAWGVPGAGGGVHILPEPAAELKPAQQATVLSKALSDINTQLREVEAGSLEESVLKNQQKEYRDMLGNIAKGKSTKGKAVPAIGTTLKGHRFLGGDPSQQSSWEKVN